MASHYIYIKSEIFTSSRTVMESKHSVFLAQWTRVSMAVIFDRRANFNWAVTIADFHILVLKDEAEHCCFTSNCSSDKH